MGELKNAHCLFYGSKLDGLTLYVIERPPWRGQSFARSFSDISSIQIVSSLINIRYLVCCNRFCSEAQEADLYRAWVEHSGMSQVKDKVSNRSATST